MLSSLRIIFITSSINYPFYRKRLISYHNLGLSFKVLGFKRNIHYPLTELPVDYEFLGNIQQGNYIKRLMKIIAAIPKIRMALKNTDVVYSFGLDMAILSFLSLKTISKKPKLIYEVHDVRDVMMKRNLAGFLVRYFEKMVIRNIALLVVTSRSYIDNYYKEILKINISKYIVLENKLRKDEIGLTTRFERSISTPLRIGYFGALRCIHAWNALKEIAVKSKGKIEIYVRGIPYALDSFQSDIESTPNLIYEGPYRDPDDLQDIYSKVDIVWAAGFHQKRSYSWSRTCRFYYACCYQKPIITQVDTDDQREVDKYTIGCSIDLNDVSSTVDRILSISRDEIDRWRNNISKVPQEVYVYQDEHESIVRNMRD